MMACAAGKGLTHGSQQAQTADMDSFLIDHEPGIRMGVFFGLLGLMAIAEAIFPARARLLSRKERWPSAVALILLNALILRGVFPALAVGFAAISQDLGWGVIPALGLGFWPATLLAFVLMDLAIWAQHVAMHHVPLLWRFHRMHHSDVDLDAVSGARFHPGEIVMSMAYKILVVVLVGPSVAAVIIFEVVLSGAAVFNHANIRLPRRVDRVLRWCVVTPDFHRVHHSIIPGETNSNYGFFIPWWDRVFGLYRAQPSKGHRGMTLGLDHDRDGRAARLDQLLMQPVRSRAQTPPQASEESGAG